MIKTITITDSSAEVLFSHREKNNTFNKTLVKAIQAGTKLHNVIFIGQDLSGLDLSNANLENAYFENTNLTGVDFSLANLSHAQFTETNLYKVRFYGANLSKTIFGSNLEIPNLYSASLYGANFGYGSIERYRVIIGLYRYIVIAYITEKRIKRIKMGCFDRSLKEWENDFWNNTAEFPNDKSCESQARLLAFKTAKEWLKLIK